MTRVKICCIASIAEARLAVELGAWAVGLVSEMPSGPGVIPEEMITRIAAVVPPPVSSVLLTSRTRAEDIIAQQRRCRTGALQICDSVDGGVHRALRDALPGISLIQVIQVTGEESLKEAEDVAAGVDALLLDSGNRDLTVKELGGTGRTHDWSLSARIVRKSPVPVFLAGGLNPQNVGEAIAAVRPFGVDVCSGVRMDDALDGDKLRCFMAEIR